MKNWKLGTKIIGLIILGNIMMGVLVFAYFMPMARQRMFDDKRESIRFLVESATGILAEYQQQEKSGALSREAAQQLAKAAIRPLRYGKNGYFWIDNQDYVCQLLPPKPEAENVFRGNLKDVKGNLFIQDLVNGAVRNGSTNVEYWFPKPGEQEASAKFGFTQYFEPWGWIIGTGVYVDDVDAQYAAMRTGILSGFLLVMVVFSALGFYLARKIANPLKALEKASQDIAEGDLEIVVEATTRDEIGNLATSFNSMLQSLRQKANAARALASGDLSCEKVAASPRDTLGIAMDRMRESLLALKEELEVVIRNQKAGDTDARCNPSRLTGAYAELLTGTNDVLVTALNPIRITAEILTDYARGNLTREMPELPGKQIVLTRAMNGIRKNLEALLSETGQLITHARNGRLSERIDLAGFQGSYQQLLQGINELLDSTVAPVQEASRILSEVAGGDLTRRVEGNYSGEHATIKNAVNSTVASLGDILQQIQGSAEEINGGTNQLARASQSLSEATTEQASSVEEISASMTEILGQTRNNAESAKIASQLANEARGFAHQGNQQMQEMLSAMMEINTSSGEISRIIKVIDEIAFQTNLLALNAAVEAARAGVHGKGFAVVAEEVRNLAQRSARAANETTQLIGDSVQKAENGTKLATQTAKALEKIVTQVSRVSDLITEIDTASQGQTQGIQQVNLGLEQIDKVTQSIAANSEETAAAGTELSGQAGHLQEMISRFRLSPGQPKAARESSWAEEEQSW